MDPLTEKLLERARARRETLAKKMAESNMSPRKTTVRIPLKENQSQNSEVTSYSDRKPVSPVKSRLGMQEIKPDTPAIPSVKSRLQRLADQRQQWNATTGTEMDSPQNVIPPKRHEPEERPHPVKTVQNLTRSRFAALAASINSWEDDTNHPRHYSQKEKPKTQTWQPPKQVKPTPEPSAIPTKRTAPQTPTIQSTTKVGVIAPSTQPSPPKRIRHEETKENDFQVRSQQPTGKGKAKFKTIPYWRRSSTSRRRSVNSTPTKLARPSSKVVHANRSASSKKPSSACTIITVQACKRSPVKTIKSPLSGRLFVAVGTRVDARTEDTDEPKEQPVPAPRVARTTATTPAASQSPVKMQVSASPIKRPVLQSCTAATPTIQSPPKRTVVRESPKKQAPFKQSPVKRAPIQSRGATSENFARARVLLEQGCSGGGASSKVVTSPTTVEPRVGAMAKKIHDRLREHQTNWQSNEINRKAQEARQKELALIRSRWEYPRSESPEKQEEASSVLTSQTEEDVEPEAEEYDEEDYNEEEEEDEDEVADDCPEEMTADNDAETNIDDYTTEEEEVQVNKGGTLEEEEKGTPSDGAENEEVADESEINISDVLGDIDELIVVAEQAMQEEQAKAKSLEREAAPPTSDPQADVSGWDYDVEKTEPMERQMSSSSDTSAVDPTPAPRNKRKASTTSFDSSSSQVTPHSLESYRTQQKESMSPVLVTHRTVTRDASPASTSSSKSSGGHHQERPSESTVERAKRMSTREKIQTLMEDVAAQQSIIHQTSQALELIAATEEYHGTKEEIEAEKLLVIATQRRQACLAEIQHLKNPITLPRVILTEDGEEIVPCRGSVSIKDIRLPLKTQYLMALDSGRDQAHHSYFVIVRCHEHVVATQLLSTRNIRGDCLHFTNMVCLNDLGSDFTIELLVYEMRGRCPTVDAVHGKKASSKHSLLGSLTPKKFKSNMCTVRQGGKYPPVSCHSTVRQNSFATVGSVHLSLASCQLRKVMLSKVPFLSPLEGSIHMTMSCHTDSKTHADGFLTMFDDCSGLGMWHRRWCVLNGGHLSYWKYPGDEKRKPPIGSIILKECITKEVRVISRIHCARPNTFELQTSRPSSNSDRDTLVTKHNDSDILTKHLLSADTKEDRIQWTTALNKTLLELRLWCKDAARPVQE